MPAHLFTRPAIRLSRYSPIRAFAHLLNRSFDHSCIHSVIRTFPRSCIHTYIHSLTHSYIHSLSRPPIRQSAHRSVASSPLQLSNTLNYWRVNPFPQAPIPSPIHRCLHPPIHSYFYPIAHRASVRSVVDTLIADSFARSPN